MAIGQELLSKKLLRFFIEVILNGQLDVLLLLPGRAEVLPSNVTHHAGLVRASIRTEVKLANVWLIAGVNSLDGIHLACGIELSWVTVGPFWVLR